MRRRNRVDTVQPALVSRLQQYGAGWLPLPGMPIDGVAWFRGQPFVVDFKSEPNAPLTEGQRRLVNLGCPIWFLKTDADVDRMLGVG